MELDQGIGDGKAEVLLAVVDQGKLVELDGIGFVCGDALPVVAQRKFHRAAIALRGDRKRAVFGRAGKGGLKNVDQSLRKQRGINGDIGKVIRNVLIDGFAVDQRRDFFKRMI